MPVRDHPDSQRDGRIDDVDKFRFQRRCRNHINWNSEDRFQFGLERSKRDDARGVVKINQQVNIAAGPVVVTDRAAEHSDISRTSRMCCLEHFESVTSEHTRVAMSDVTTAAIRATNNLSR